MFVIELKKSQTSVDTVGRALGARTPFVRFCSTTFEVEVNASH
jgi:hypothetical protein